MNRVNIIMIKYNNVNMIFFIIEKIYTDIKRQSIITKFKKKIAITERFYVKNCNFFSCFFQ